MCDLGKTIGKKIDTLLKENNIKQKELAGFLQVTDNTISYFARGTRTPNLQQIINIANYFNVSTDYLLKDSDVRTTDTTIKDICEYTGLSEKTVEKLSTFAEHNKKYPELDNTLEHLDTFIQSGAISMFKDLDEYLTSVKFCKYLELKYPNIDFSSFGAIVININTKTNTVATKQLTEDEKEAQSDYTEEVEKNQPVFRYNINKKFEDFITKYGEYQKEITTTENFEQYIETYNKSVQAYNDYIGNAFDSFTKGIEKIGDYLKKWGITDEVLEKHNKDGANNGNDK